MPNVNIVINGKQLTVPEGITVLEAANTNNIHIPTLCAYEGLGPKAACRVCIVKLEGDDKFKLSCATKVAEGMVVTTDSDEIFAERKATVEKMLQYHTVDCHHCLRIGSSKCDDLEPWFCETCFFCDCVRDGFCELQSLAREFRIDQLPGEIHEHDFEVDASLGSIIRNPNKCVKCRRCVDVCNNVQGIGVLGTVKTANGSTVGPKTATLQESNCVRCGRCVDSCPTGAVYMQEHKDEVVYFAHKYDTITGAQISPCVIEELEKLFKVEIGSFTMEQIVAGLKKIGIDHVYTDDYAFAAAQNQAEKLLDEKIGNGTVILTSNFAAKNFLKANYADLKDRFAFYDSIQQIFEAAVKTHFANDANMKIYTFTNGNSNGSEAQETGCVDYSVNAREMYRIFTRTGVSPAKLFPIEAECFGEMKVSAKYGKLLDHADWLLCKEPEALELAVDGKVVKAAIAHNLGQARRLLEQVKEGNYTYDVIRILA